jgi:DNA-binding PadR family transcriptional regulator
VQEGSLYPALYRLETEVSIESEWGVSDNKRRAKFYALTPLGRRMLRAEESRWTRFVATMGRVLAATPRTVAEQTR